MSNASHAESLSPEALYYRCYGQLVRGRPPADDPRLLAVQEGGSAIDACAALLDLAALEDDGMLRARVGASVDPIAKAILKTFQSFHAAWFPASDFNELPYDDPNYDIYDIGEMALHLTHALLAPATKLSSVVTVDQSFEALRAATRPSEYLIYGATVSGKTSEALRLDGGRFMTGIGTLWNPTLVQLGPMVGIRHIPPGRDVLTHLAYGREVNLDIHRSFGGGVLGTTPFLLLNLGRFEGERANGGLVMPRRWSRAVMKSLLCRDLPVVRATDAIRLVEPQSPLPFRGSHTCMQCHGTMDGMAGVIRNVELARSFQGPVAERFITKHVIQNPTSTRADVSFDEQRPDGHFFFRNLDGELVDRHVTGLPELGQLLSEQVDLYACVAKRYVALLTGIDVRLNDPGDPNTPPPSPEYSAQRQVVIDLALALMQDQSLRMLVRRIFELPAYSSVGFQVAR